MLSNSLPKFQELQAKLKAILKKYKEQIEDIVIFGSYVKNKIVPNDIDVGIVVKEIDLELVGKIANDINDERVHLELFELNKLFKNPLWNNLMREGYSIKEGKFLREINDIKPMKLYNYNLTVNHLTQSDKVRFNRALNNILDESGGMRISTGSVAIPTENTGDFEDFLKVWEKEEKSYSRGWNILLF